MNRLQLERLEAALVVSGLVLVLVLVVGGILWAAW